MLKALPEFGEVSNNQLICTDILVDDCCEKRAFNGIERARSKATVNLIWGELCGITKKLGNLAFWKHSNFNPTAKVVIYCR